MTRVQMLPGFILGESPLEQCELLIVRNLRAGHRPNYKVVGPAMDYLEQSNEQFLALLKCCRLGWKIRSCVFNHQTRQVAFGIAGPNCGAWLLPSGELIRPAAGKTTAYLPQEWAKIQADEM